MCGRTCLTLEPNQIRCACKYRPTNKNKHVKEESLKDNDLYEMPEWRPEFNCGRTYQPSYNIAPTDVSPVLVSAAHFESEDSTEQQRVLMVPMMWGMIPFWHKGDYRRHGLTTNNCRLEHMRESKLYRGPFRRGQRCVVLCEGFYEWQTSLPAKPSERAVHFLYMPQADGVKIYDKSSWTEQQSDQNNLRLLKLAGLFDVWEDEHGDNMYSYSVITFESTQLMSWLHHRMPAILETETQVADWLDFKRVTDDAALATLAPAQELQWHRVSNMVNNWRHKSDQCNKPIELVAKKPQMNKTMAAWLTARKVHNLDENEDENSPKRYKMIGKP